jgi:hypothetical protein
MSLFERKIRPPFVTAPAEPPMPDEARVADLDAQAYEAFLAGDTAKADRLLDLRNAIRPGRPARPRPVVPGRVGSIIDNRRENP